jgi:hypothetical protein
MWIEDEFRQDLGRQPEIPTIDRLGANKEK